MSLHHTVRVDLPRAGYDVHIASGAEQAWTAPLRPLVEGRHVAVVTDNRVESLYRDAFSASLKAAGVRRTTWCAVPPGEQSKRLEVLDGVYDTLLGDRLGRDGVVCALGGGVVGDLGGFAAATVHRGVDFIQVPTTLLAMVDSSIGGKVGINHAVGKNLVGAFHQPGAVLANLDVLQTLSARELTCGIAEVIKYGVIADPALFSRLEKHALAIQTGDFEHLLDIVVTSATIKADVVVRDEREGGLRMVLNFGHTLGHAIEATSGYGKWSHGEAIAVGMVMAAEFGVELGHTPQPLIARIRELCEVFHLPAEIAPADRPVLATSVGHDKKVRGSDVRFVIARSLGHVTVESVPLVRLEGWLRQG